MPSKRTLSIFIVVFLFMATLVGGFKILSQGITIPVLRFADIQVRGLYLKLNNKFLLDIAELDVRNVLQKRGIKQSSKTPSIKEISDYVKYALWGLAYFENLRIDKILLDDNYAARVVYDGEHYALSFPQVEAIFNVQSHHNGIELDIRKLAITQPHIEIGGRMAYASASGKLSFRLVISPMEAMQPSHHANSAQHALDTMLQAESMHVAHVSTDTTRDSARPSARVLLQGTSDFKRLVLRAKSTTFENLNTLRTLITPYASSHVLATLDMWLFHALQAKGVSIEQASFDVSLHEKHLLPSLLANTKLTLHITQPTYTLDASLTPFHAERAIIRVENAAATLSLHAPMLDSLDLSGSNLVFSKLDSAPMLVIHALSQHLLYNQALRDVLAFYHISLPFEQISGDMSAKLAISIPLHKEAYEKGQRVGVDGEILAHDVRIMTNGVSLTSKHVEAVITIPHDTSKVGEDIAIYTKHTQLEPMFDMDTETHIDITRKILHSRLFVHAVRISTNPMINKNNIDSSSISTLSSAHKEVHYTGAIDALPHLALLQGDVNPILASANNAINATKIDNVTNDRIIAVSNINKQQDIPHEDTQAYSTPLLEQNSASATQALIQKTSSLESNLATQINDTSIISLSSNSPHSSTPSFITPPMQSPTSKEPNTPAMPTMPDVSLAPMEELIDITSQEITKTMEQASPTNSTQESISTASTPRLQPTSQEVKRPSTEQASRTALIQPNFRKAMSEQQMLQAITALIAQQEAQRFTYDVVNGENLAPIDIEMDFSSTPLRISIPIFSVSMQIDKSIHVSALDFRKLAPLSPLMRYLGLFSGGGTLDYYDANHVSFSTHIQDFPAFFREKDGLPLQAFVFNGRYTDGRLQILSDDGRIGLDAYDNTIIVNLKDLDVSIDSVLDSQIPAIAQLIDTKDADVFTSAEIVRESAFLRRKRRYEREHGIKPHIIAIQARNITGFFKDITLPFDDVNARIRDGRVGVDASYKNGVARVDIIHGNTIVTANNFNGEFVNRVVGEHIVEGGLFELSGVYKHDIFHGDMRLQNTSFKGFTIVQNVIGLIDSIPSLVMFRSPGLSTKGYEVRQGDMSLAINPQYIGLESINLIGKTIDVQGSGVIELDSKEVDMGLSISTLKNLSSILNKIPVVGYLLLGNDGRVMTQVSVRGTTAEPKTQISLAQDLLKTPLNVIKRAFAPIDIAIDEIIKSIER